MRVLLVEDNAGDADLVRDALTAHTGDAIEFVHVERIGAAAAQLTAQRFDVILLDLALPDAMGLEGLQRLRQAAPSAPIVILTGLIDEVVNTAALQQGAQDFLYKGQIASAGLMRSIRYARDRQQHVDRDRLLAELGAALGGAIDPAGMIEALLGVVGKDYASWCGLEGCVATPGSFDELLASHVGRGHATLFGSLAGPPGAGAERVRTADLLSRGMSSAIVVHFAASGYSAGVLVFARDQGRPAYGEADRAVAEEVTVRLTAALEYASLLAVARQERERAELASQLRDDFLATLSHELRTPLGSILGWTQMLRDGGLSPEKQAKALETIERNAHSQAALIGDMLDVSRIITGKMRLEISEVSLAAVVAAAVETVRPAANAKSVGLSVEEIAEAGAVRGDPDRLQQVFWNLLANAVKFTPRGGSVLVSSRRLESTVELEVADTGQGISAEFVPHVFERFRQADSSKKRAHAGLGLGLAISQQLVELHGGTIRAESAGPDKGTTFVVSLPLHAAERAVAPAGHRSPPSAPRAGDVEAGDLTGLRVLLVDDDRDLLELLRSVFELSGSDVTTATSAAAAFAALSAAPPEILISDVGMPGETGYELIRRVRSLPSALGGSTVAIALTAYARDEDEAEAISAGYDRHVAKPVQLKDLLALVTQLVRPRAR